MYPDVWSGVAMISGVLVVRPAAVYRVWVGVLRTYAHHGRCVCVCVWGGVVGQLGIGGSVSCNRPLPYMPPVAGGARGVPECVSTCGHMVGRYGVWSGVECVG